jgi:hypothetical protein
MSADARLRLLITALLCVAAPVRAARAHDFWIEPSTFHPFPGTAVALHLRVGQNFIGDPVPRQSVLIDSFLVRQGTAQEDIGGADGLDPAGMLIADGQASALVGYSGGGTYIELPPDRFTDYLHQYGLRTIIALRAAKGETDKIGKERFYRYAKAVLAGLKPDPDVSRPLGFTYEIVPDQDPTQIPAGHFQGHLLYRGKPAPDVLVTAYPWHQPTVHLQTRSDPQGGFQLDLKGGGVWLLESVIMVRAGFFSDNDWDSHWASLTFDLGPSGQQ